jgi:GWxTD domain-containing protein
MRSHHYHYPSRLWLVFLLCVAAVGALAVPPAFAETHEKLSPYFREWLDRDVAYIITRAEKNAFQQLTSDEARNQFIEQFWEIRNPTPGAPTNPYKEEHYKRLEYASDHFSSNKSRDGWKTDMGRIYITLGPPEQKGRYVTQSEVRGMEIWFYSASHPALPPFFNIVFYEKDFGDFRLYSPRMDGPQKLVSNHQMENGAVASVQTIDRILGREVALTTLSLIPGEPVNINDAETSLQSDVMLNTIKNLANHPFTIDALNLRRSLNESVSHRVVMSGELLNVLTVPLRDPLGDIRLHYAMRLSHPADFGVAESADRYYYSIEVSVRVLTPEKKLIFSQERKLSRYIDKDEMELMKSRPFGYESWLPLAPGKYKLELVLTNILNKTSFTAERDVVVPAPPQDAFALTDVVAFSQAKTIEPAQAAVLPFTCGGVNFTPYVGPELNLLPGEDLKIFYQIWLPPTHSENLAGKKLLVDYAYGRPSLTGTAQVIHDEVAKDQFDLGGALINGKKIPTTDLPAGNYRMAITVTDPETQQKRFGSFSFHIVSDQASPLDAWDAYDDLADYVKTGQAEYERGLTYLLAADPKQAAQWFTKALKKNPNNEMARARLADFYFSQRDFAKVLELYSQMVVTPQTEEETILNVADSFDKTGNVKKAADVVESAIAVKPASGPLYLALSSYYQRLGDAQKAGELERKGRSLMTTANP